MTKIEAIQQMSAGIKMTHKYFSPDEWVTMKYGKLLFEDGVVCDLDEFCSWRANINWENDWSVYVIYLWPK